jgi:protoheme IX farnesyltransferase
MASGTSALNQCFEVDSDARIFRTRNRPISAGSLKLGDAISFGVLLSVTGFAALWLGASHLAAALGLFTLLSYLFLYTPLKRRSPACTRCPALCLH